MRRVVIAAAAAIAGWPAGVLAEEPKDSYWVELSYVYPSISSVARLDQTSTARPGTTIKLEDDLDLASRAGAPYLTLGMRIDERWRVEFEYFRLKRSADKVIDRQIDWGDATFTLSTQVSSTFNIQVFRLTGGYSFYKEPQGEAGVGFGLHVTDFFTALSGVVSVAPGSQSFQKEAQHTLVPLPTVGLQGTYKMASQLQVRGRVDFLSLDYQQYDGALLDWQATADWRFAGNASAGIGYRYVNYKLRATSTDFHGDLNHKIKGPTLSLSALF